VPYLVFGQWLTSDFSSAAVDSVLELFRDAPAIIIDVRMNGGGDESLALSVASRFYDMARVATHVRYRNGPRHSDLGPPQPVVVDRRGSWQFTKPVLVLVGPGCFSSTEAFVAAMRVLPNVTVVGDTTGGGSGNPRTFSLGGGWQYSVPRWIEYTSTMDVIEWNGIAPNVVVPVSDADWSAGRDPVLDYAARWAAERGGPPGAER
jgi:C-terminal processing protease CtpA/Prc